MKPDFKKIPPSTGVYQFYNRERIIYIGKAKNLRARIRSYWTNRELEPAKAYMVCEISRVEYTLVENELEAILLEAVLIKKHQPKYNIVMRDDKSWMYIVIIREPFPRIVTVRGAIRRRGECFGPYTNASVAKTIIRVLHRVLPLRTCSRNLATVPRGRVCLQFHLGRCRGPCEARIDETMYNAYIKQAREILRGNTKNLVREITDCMKANARQKKFEQAAQCRNKLWVLDRIRVRQNAVSPSRRSFDVIGIVNTDGCATVCVMQVRHGQLLDTLRFPIANSLYASTLEVLEAFLAQYYLPTGDKPAELVLPCNVSAACVRALAPIRFRYPVRGPKNHLLDLAFKNAWDTFQRQKTGTAAPESLYLLKETLSLDRLPLRIEAYDVSNIGGSHAVGAMAVARNGAIARSAVRQFRIRTVVGANDVAMLREIILRRLRHEEWGEPDLILVDGGKPQLSAVYPIVPPSWRRRLIALAKRDENIFMPDRTAPIRLPRHHKALLLLIKLRDEAHRRAHRYFQKRHRKHLTLGNKKN